MSALVFSATDICRTRLCAAALCEADAMIGHSLCERCSKRQLRGHAIVMHEVVQPASPDRETMLVCLTCSTWKPDAEFSRHSAEKNRRERHNECKQCANVRKRVYRANFTPEQRARQAERDRFRHLNQTPEQREAKNAQARAARAARAAMKAATRGVR